MAQAMDKQQAHDLINRMTPEQVQEAIPVLKSMLDTNVDDEPVTEGDRKAIARSEAWFKANGGRGIPMSEVLADFGLTMDDFPLKEHGSDSHD